MTSVSTAQPHARSTMRRSLIVLVVSVLVAAAGMVVATVMIGQVAEGDPIVLTWQWVRILLPVLPLGVLIGIAVQKQFVDPIESPTEEAAEARRENTVAEAPAVATPVAVAPAIETPVAVAPVIETPVAVAPVVAEPQLEQPDFSTPQFFPFTLAMPVVVDPAASEAKDSGTEESEPEDSENAAEETAVDEPGSVETVLIEAAPIEAAPIEAAPTDASPLLEGTATPEVASVWPEHMRSVLVVEPTPEPESNTDSAPDLGETVAMDAVPNNEESDDEESDDEGPVEEPADAVDDVPLEETVSEPVLEDSTVPGAAIKVVVPLSRFASVRALAVASVRNGESVEEVARRIGAKESLVAYWVSKDRESA